jgi:hypothetical protein
MIAGDDRELFAASLRRATETTTGAALDAALDDIGWRDALDADRRTAVSLLFELQGSAGATSTALDRVLSEVLGLDGTTPVLHPPIGSTTPPGVVAESGVDVRGIARSSAEGLDEFTVVVAARDAGAVGWARVGVDELALRPVSGMDPASGLVEVGGEDFVVEVEPLHPDAWHEAVAAAQLALSHELIGASRAMLTLARDHAVERVQFGRPIAQFQAVRHRLADTYVAIESAEAAVDAAWDDGSPLAAAVAKAIAGRNARLAARHCQQVLAGIGFTADHSFHGYLRRVLVLERLFGDARSLTTAIGKQLLRTRQVPSLLPL